MMIAATHPDPQTLLLFDEWPVQLFETPTHCAHWLAGQLEAGLETPWHIVTLNPEMIMRAEADPDFFALLHGADVRFADGAGVVWALRLAGHQHAVRIPGIEVAESLLGKATEEGWRVAIIGASADVLEAACERLLKRYPGIDIAFRHHGFFEADSPKEAAIAQAVANTRPHLVLVALGVPRQELWISQYRQLFGNTLMMGVGGSVDVWSGTVQRAPELVRKLHAEWVWRLSSQPWRIKRAGGPLLAFLKKMLGYQLKRK